MSARRDSNPRPRPWQGRAPPTEPLAHLLYSANLPRICLEQVMGIEPTYPAWKASILPMNYTCIYNANIITQHSDFGKCPEPESNQRHEDFQSSALPTELSGHTAKQIFNLHQQKPLYTLSLHNASLFLIILQILQ